VFIFQSVELGLINYWPLDNHVNDTVGGAHMYNGYNFEFVSDRFGDPNSAIRFTEGYYQIPPGVYFNGDYTISVWIKAINTLDAGIIMDFGNSGSDKIKFMTSYTSYVSYAVKPTFYVYTRSSYSTIETSNSLTIGQWTHLLFTSSENSGSVYMNGLLIGKTNNIFTPRNINRTSNYIGRSDGYSNLWADLDDLKIYNRSMSPAEINALFLQQVKTASSNLLGYKMFIY
jgi:hypothetical protein